jgi:dTMP kinase
MSLLISIEGINGVGKTYLTRRLLAEFPEAVVLDGFSERARARCVDLGRLLLDALIADAGGDPFLRSGHPAAETLLLLAIKSHDWEARCLPALRAGRPVLEGRSLHSVATYQALILHSDDDRLALDEAHAILDLARRWRPLPDLTVLILDNVDAAIARLEHRDQTRCGPDQRRMHLRADRLYRQLAAADPRRIKTVDRTEHTAAQTVETIRVLIADHLTEDAAR